MRTSKYFFNHFFVVVGNRSSQDLEFPDLLVLEDPTCYVKNLPSVVDLLSRLKPKAVEDPFLRSNGEKWTER